MAFSAESFIFAVFLMYGLVFMIYTASDGAIVGLPSANAFEPSGPATGGIVDAIVGTFEIIISFFGVMFLPLLDVWWLAPINWAITGSAVYLFMRLLRGGG